MASSEVAARDRAASGPGGPDPLVGDPRRAGLLTLLVLHYVAREPSYGNQLMDRIAELTHGALVVNPNTMYPLLRALEADGLLVGHWEHPDRRSRRDRKSTRLNSSHANISYAVFCLKK